MLVHFVSADPEKPASFEVELPWIPPVETFVKVSGTTWICQGSTLILQTDSPPFCRTYVEYFDE